MKKYYVLIFTWLFFVSAHGAAAAGIYLLPEQGTAAIAETIIVDIKVDSEGENINAVQSKISWFGGALELIDVSKDGSAFTFWLEEPTVSSESNSLRFVGGTIKGISGGALQILRLTFRAAVAGTEEFSITDAAITASDGKGTNVLSKVKGASFRIGLEVIQPQLPAEESPKPAAISTSPQLPAEESPKPATAPIQQPVRVERQAILARDLPQKPEIKIPQYADEKQWHNYLGEVMALWNVPSDITAVAVAFDNNPNTVPSKAEKELTTGHNFGISADGIWYIHARFKNNIGWSPAAHFRLAIDTQPPLPFEIIVLEGETTDNPAPIIQFKSSDTFSGLKEYEIKIDGNETIKISAAEFTGNFTLPLQIPGAHRVVVRAVDEAGNSVEDDAVIEILPIPSPTITFITKDIFSEEERGLNIKGIALPNVKVLLRVEQVLTQGRGEVVASRTAQTDDSGNWEYTFIQPFRNGRYILTAQSQDERGALSLAVESQEARVRNKPIIQIGILQLGKGGAAFLSLCVLVVGFGGGVWFYRRRQKKLTLRLWLVKTDLVKVFRLIQNDIEKLQQAFRTPTRADDKFIIKRLQDNIKKMEGYLKKEVEKIKR